MAKLKIVNITSVVTGNHKLTEVDGKAVEI